ncbi:MAG: NAD(P)-dependent oxidoreductase [Lachnospiraceae bacterium]|nr:NAD(P)-dependent oxidoreductase [Lachnospiraceae bacterium]
MTFGERKTFLTLGASKNPKSPREKLDFYATDPKAMELLLEKEKFSEVWECAVGECHIASVLESHGILRRKSDVVDRMGGGIEVLNFLSDENNKKWHGDIVTNPPYKYALEFVEKALSLIEEGRKVAMFLRIQFLEGQKRRMLFDREPPKAVYVPSRRLSCAKNGDFKNYGNGAVCYAWFVWERGFGGKTVVEWIN